MAISTESEKGDLKEFISLSAYGLSTSLVNGVDRFIMVASGYSLSFLGYYSFLYSLGNTPTILVEAFKKSINPIMYKELSTDGQLSKSTKKNVLAICGILFIVQLTVPAAVYFVLKYLNLINPEFIMDKAYIYIYILSIGFFFQGVYHFLNPYYFFFRKSGLLLLIQAICMGVYFLVIRYISTPLDYSGFMWVKTGLLVSITVLLLLVKNNVNQEEKKVD
ncbi:polysaccharide biosynthesis protein [Mucilaginibacter puniceus]